MLVASYDPALASGVAKSVSTEAQGLAVRGHEIVVVTRRLDRNWSSHQWLDDHEVYRYRVPEVGSRLFLINPLYTLTKLPGLIRKLHQRRPFDVAYVHNPYQATAALLLARLDIPMVYAFHFPLSEDIRIEAQYGKFRSLGPLMKAMALVVRAAECHALQQADLVVVHSDFMRELMQKTSGVSPPRSPVKLLPLAVDTQRFTPPSDREAVRVSLGVPRDRDVLLTVRRLVGRMGLVNLIDALAIVVEHNPRAMLLIGGTGYLESTLQERICRLGVGKHVRLLGFISETQLPLYYQAADLFVLPTEQMEGFGLVTIESLSCGTPVIATPVSANPEVVGPLDPAFLCADVTPEALAERINWWLDHGISPQLRRTCRDYCVSRFSIDGVVTSLEDILTGGAGSKGMR